MIKSTLYNNQKNAAKFIKSNKIGIIGLKPGRGKSLSILSAIDYYTNQEVKRTVIVFCNKSAYDLVWEQEIKKHSDLKAIKFEDAVDLAATIGWRALLDQYHIILVKYSRCLGNEHILQPLCKGRIVVLEECLSGDTLINTLEYGPLPIQVVVESRLPVSVLSYNTETKVKEYRKVLQWFANKPKTLYRLTGLSGRTIVCTETHSFYIKETNSYKPFSSISPGEYIQLENGDSDRVVSKELFSEAPLPTFNIEVEYNHNYYADEILVSNCHNLKNPNTQRTNACRIATSSALAKWGMTATALSQNIEDLWGVFNFLDPSIFGSILDFRAMYCVFEDKQIGYDRVQKKARVIREVTGYKNLTHLKAIVDKYIFQEEEEQDSDLVPEFKYLHYTTTDAEEALYFKAAQGILKDNQITGFASRLPDLQRVCDGSISLEGVNVTHVRSSKYLVFLEYVKTQRAKGESVLVFSDYHFTIAMLYNLLREDLPNDTVYQMHGKQSDTISNSSCVILTTQAGSESVNLAMCNHVVMYSVPFNVKTFIQLGGRITRKDTKYRGNLHVAMMRNSGNIDEYKCRLIEAHSEMIQAIMGSEGNLPKSIEAYRHDLIHELRDTLLWKIRKTRKK